MKVNPVFFLVTIVAVSMLLFPACAPAGEQKPASGSLGPTPSPKAAEQPRYGGILRLSHAEDPQNMDLHQEAGYETQHLLQCAYNGLTQMDPNDPEQVIGDLAKSWEVSKDGLTYTFRLHDNVKFHNGTTLTAEDVKSSFDRQIDPPKGVRAARLSDVAAISRVEAPDKNTAVFILKYTSSPFLAIISTGFWAIYSKAFVEKKGDMKRDVMGTGPYKFKDYAIGTSMEHIKNPDYFVQGRPYLDGITIYIIKDASTRFAAFRSGQVHSTGPGVSGPSPAEVETLKNNFPQVIVLSYPGFLHGNFVLSTQQEPWTDIRVRKAVHLAIDRQAAVKVLTSGYGYVGSYFAGKWGIPKEELEKMPGFRQPKDADIAEAKKLLAEAGHPNGFSVKSLVTAGRDTQDIATFVEGQMRQINIKLELDVRERAVRTKLLNEGAFNNHPGNSAMNYSDPQGVARYWAKPMGDNWFFNWQRFVDEKIWELFDKQSRTMDEKERMKIVRELDLRLIDQAARPIVFWSYSNLAMWPLVKNRGRLLGDYSFQKYQDVWLAE